MNDAQPRASAAADFRHFLKTESWPGKTPAAVASHTMQEIELLAGPRGILNEGKLLAFDTPTRSGPELYPHL